MTPKEFEKQAERMVKDMMDGIAGSHYQYFLDILQAVRDAATHKEFVRMSDACEAHKKQSWAEGFNEALEKAANELTTFEGDCFGDDELTVLRACVAHIHALKLTQEGL